MPDPAPDSAGIFVWAGEAPVSPTEVRDVIETYWTARGADVVDRDPRRCEALSLHRSGRVGFAVQRIPDDRWVRVVDSERLTSDPVLARHLHEVLGVEVVAYARSERLGRGWMVRHRHGGRRQWHDLAEVTARVADLAGAGQVMPTFAPDEPYEVDATLCFDGILATPGRPYQGPEPHSAHGRTVRHRRLSRLRSARSPAYAEALDVHADLAEASMGDLHSVDLAHEGSCAFVLGLADRILGIEQESYRKRARTKLAEAALRAGETELFEQVHGSLAEPTRAWNLAAWTHALAAEGQFELALAAFLRLHHDHEPDPRAWNNLCFVLAHLDDADWPQPLQPWLAEAALIGPSNPALFHNLAVVQLRTGDLSGALDSVEGALCGGYALAHRIRDDDDLQPLRSHPRWSAAWAAHDREPEPTPRPSTVHKTLTPRVGCTVDGVGRFEILDDVDDLEASLGPPSSGLDAAHGVFRFDVVGLTVAMVDGTRAQIHHLRAPVHTRVLGVDLHAGAAEVVVQILADRLGARPTHACRDDLDAWAFVEVDLELKRYGRSSERGRLTTAILHRPGQLARARERRGRQRRARSRAARELAEARDQLLSRALRDCFDARSP